MLLNVVYVLVITHCGESAVRLDAGGDGAINRHRARHNTEILTQCTGRCTCN